MKAILISIKPKWVAKILNGEKDIEVRKSIVHLLSRKAKIHTILPGIPDQCQHIFLQLLPCKVSRGIYHYFYISHLCFLRSM